MSADHECPDPHQAFGPGPNHKVLSIFVGAWRVQAAMFFTPDAEPQAFEGTMVARWVLSDRFLDQRFTGAGYQGRDYWGYNNGAQRYEGIWVDSDSTGILRETGSYDAQRRDFPHPATGESIKRRSVISVVFGRRAPHGGIYAGPDRRAIPGREINLLSNERRLDYCACSGPYQASTN